MNNQLEIIKNILLAHKGINNAISSAEIAHIIDIPDEGSHFEIRRLIKDCINYYMIPVAACSKGYFFISNKQEMENYKIDLTKRSDAILDRLKKIQDNFNSFEIS